MVLKLYNTLSRKKEIFKPIEKGKVKIYVCGPTVNDVPHLGHARSQISFDILRRYLIYSGYKVKFVSNVTDIEDKIIDKAKELGIKIEDLTRKNLKEHLEDYSKLGVLKPDVQPFATQYINQMVDLIKKLESKGFTYLSEGGVYFDISKFKEYGKLSKQNTKNLQKGKRVKEKTNNDFVLWKFSKLGEPFWNSPWGNGRPGWHIECSAMSYSILGLPLDIHGGGQDLIFPHHEDEIAQSEVAYGKPLANYWVHNGMVNVDKIKMSKSLGNFKTIKDLLKEYPGEVIRYFVFSSHYRKPIDFSKKALEISKNSYERLKNLVSELKDDKIINKKFLKEFTKSMDDDLNTPQALQVLWKLIRDSKVQGKVRVLKKMDEVFGLNLFKKEKLEIPPEIKKLSQEREKARKKKNWNLADDIREKIKEKGYEIEDSQSGSIIKKIK